MVQSTHPTSRRFDLPNIHDLLHVAAGVLQQLQDSTNSPSVRPSERQNLAHVLLAGHLGRVAAQLGVVHRVPEARLLARSLLRTAAISVPPFLAPNVGAFERLSELVQTAGPEWEIEQALPVILFTTEDLAQAGARLLELADAHPLMTLDARACVQAGGWTPPTSRYDPLNPPLDALLSPPTRSAQHQPRERALRTLLEGAAPLEQYSAAVLMAINARDGQPNMDVIGLLDTLHQVLETAQRQRRLVKEPAGHLPELHQHLQAIHHELGCPRLSAWRRRGPLKMSPEILTRTVQAMLRDLRVWRSPLLAVLLKDIDDTLWENFDAFDQQLAQGETPELNSSLRLGLMLWGVLALLTTDRAPGMMLPPVVEIAVQLSGIDPLWCWAALQEDTSHRAQLIQATRLVLLALEHRQQHPSDEAERAVRQAGGHLLASVRLAGIRLPDQAFIQQMFEGGQVLRSVPLTDIERATLLHRLQERMTAARPPTERDQPHVQTGEERPRENGSPDDTLAAETSPQALDLPALHLLEARRLLKGQHVLILGGQPRTAQHAALMSAFELASLEWIAPDEYAHGTHAAVRLQPRTALVILAIRWMGHAHSTLRSVAGARGVPVVMHPGGLNPNSVAYQVMRQVSQQLQLRAGA